MKMTALCIVFSMLFLRMTAVSQVSITNPTPAGSYVQHFDLGFPGTGDYTLTDNAAANLGWYSFRTIGNVAGGNVFTANVGNSLVGQFYNYGLAGDPNRALGSVANIGATGTMYYGLRIQNDTGTNVSSVRIQYAGEQWLAFFPIAQTLAFSYQVSPTDITSLTAGTFTPEPALNFTTPVTGFAGPLDGNQAANRAALDQTLIVAIPPGSEIMLRWEDAADAAVLNHGIAIDDVTVSFFIFGPTAANVSISGRAVTASGVGIGNATLVLSGGLLPEPLIARTNPFGYYQIDGVPAGNTYLLEISSKQYTFAQSSQVINAQDNVAGIDFIADSK